MFQARHDLSVPDGLRPSPLLENSPTRTTLTPFPRNRRCLVKVFHVPLFPREINTIHYSPPTENLIPFAFIVPCGDFRCRTTLSTISSQKYWSDPPIRFSPNFLSFTQEPFLPASFSMSTLRAHLFNKEVFGRFSQLSRSLSLQGFYCHRCLLCSSTLFPTAFTSLKRPFLSCPQDFFPTFVKEAPSSRVQPSQGAS